LASQVANAKLNSQRDKRGERRRKARKDEGNTMLVSLLAAFAKKNKDEMLKYAKE